MSQQEQITEEMSRFQESFEQMIKRLESIEMTNMKVRTEEVLDQVNSRVETLELEQQENMEAQ